MEKSLNISSREFRHAGHNLVDRIAEFLDELPEKKVTQNISPSKSSSLVSQISIKEEGEELHTLLSESAELLFENSLFNGHPRFWGYITSSATPIGALADLLASSINANVGAYALAPMATEIEKQTIEWLSGLIGFESSCGGTMVSGGNMANFLGFLAARRALLPNIRKIGISNASSSSGLTKENPSLITYCAKGTHTWVQKATDMFGHGTDSIRWIELDNSGKLNSKHLEQQLQRDMFNGDIPFIIIANAGSVSTGVVDNIEDLSNICRKHDIWLHVDGAYGAIAAILPELCNDFQGLKYANSIALDPHKWLYSPIEAGCILVRDGKNLQDAFGFNPEYYNFGGNNNETPLNFHEYGMQNSRGFKALKVWLSLRYVGKNGLMKMIRNDIHLAKKLYNLVRGTEELQEFTQHLSITTFRFVPKEFSNAKDNEYLNLLNEKLLSELQRGGEVFLSNAVLDGMYCLRVCIVNFRTTEKDIESLVQIVLDKGRTIHNTLSKNVNPISD